MVKVKLSALNEGRWYEYLIRFALGGVTTVIAGMVANIWGPETGGLFLAFPAILCASATLVEAHERREKREHGVEGHRRGTDAAALETAGAVMGSLGMAGFGLFVWLLAPKLGLPSLGLACVVWLAMAILSWRVRGHLRSTRASPVLPLIDEHQRMDDGLEQDTGRHTGNHAL